MIVSSYKCDICQHLIDEGYIVTGKLERINGGVHVTSVVSAETKHICESCMQDAVEDIDEVQELESEDKHTDYTGGR